jgi:hypothetical protein
MPSDPSHKSSTGTAGSDDTGGTALAGPHDIGTTITAGSSETTASTSVISIEAEHTKTILPDNQMPVPPSEVIAHSSSLHLFQKRVNSLVTTYLPKPDEPTTERKNELIERLFGRYVRLYQSLEHPDNIQYSGMANIGISALHSGRYEMADTIHDIIRYNTSPSAALVAVMKGVWRFAICFFIFVVLSFSSLYIFPYCLSFSDNPTLISIRESIEGNSGKVVLAAISGCFGGIVSLLLRLSEFETMKRRSKEFMELTGATLPLVGGISAAVVGAIFSADIININAGTESGVHGLNPWLYVVIGFLAGFSERFTRKVFRVAEDKLGIIGIDHQASQLQTEVQSNRLTLGVNTSESEVGAKTR